MDHFLRFLRKEKFKQHTPNSKTGRLYLKNSLSLFSSISRINTPTVPTKTQITAKLNSYSTSFIENFYIRKNYCSVES